MAGEALALCPHCLALRRPIPHRRAASFSPPLSHPSPRVPAPRARAPGRLWPRRKNSDYSRGEGRYNGGRPEYPDEGFRASGSDDDDDDPGAGEASSANYVEELIKEVEQLLTPEEKAILDANEVPNLSKISTPKWHPLHTLALATQIPLMDKLLESGADIDVVDQDGVTALHKAVLGKKEPVVSHLLRKGANPHLKDKDGATVLHYAVQVGALLTVKLLIKYKVNINEADNDGWTPLHLALQSRNRDIAKILLVNGADKTRPNKDGRTPLDISLCFGKDFKSYDLGKLVKLVPENNRL